MSGDAGWAGSTPEVLDDLKRFNAPQDVLDAVELCDSSQSDYLVWPENWKVVRAFLASATQWRIAAGMDGITYLGFDYSGVGSGLKKAKIKLNKSQWSDLQMMEAKAIKALNER